MLGQSLHTTAWIDDAQYAAFVSERMVNFTMSDADQGTRVDENRFGCATIASGESELVEHVMDRSMELMLDLLEKSENVGGSLVDPPFEMLPDVEVIKQEHPDWVWQETEVRSDTPVSEGE